MKNRVTCFLAFLLLFQGKGLLGQENEPSSSFWEVWSVPLLVSNGKLNYTLTFSANTSATDYFDLEYDELMPPPNMSYYAFFQVNYFPYYLKTNCLEWPSTGNEPTKYWFLKVRNAQDDTTVIRWNYNDFYRSGSFTLHGGVPKVDMCSQNSVSFAGDKNIEIKYCLFGPDTLFTNNNFGAPEQENRQIIIHLTNLFRLRNLSFYLNCSEGVLTFQSVELTDRCRDFSRNVEQWEGKKTTEISIYPGSAFLEPGSGPIMRFNYKVDRLAKPGTQVGLTLRFVHTSDHLKRARYLYTRTGTFDIIGKKGDVNSDAEADILDLLLLVAFINQQRTPTPYEFWPADLNDDAVLDIQDVVALVNLIIDPGMKKMGLPDSQPAKLTIAPAKPQSPTRATIPVSLSSNSTLAGLQFKLNLPEGLKICTPEHSGNVKSVFNQNEKQATLLFYSLENQIAAPGEKFSFDLPLHFASGTFQTPEFQITEIIAVDPNAAVLPVEVNHQSEITVLPEAFCLEKNYPNPFNPITHLTFHLPVGTTVSLEIFNGLGQKVKTLIHEFRPAGIHQTSWDGTDDFQQAVGSGVYLCVFSAGEFRQIQKMLLVR